MRPTIPTSARASTVLLVARAHLGRFRRRRRPAAAIYSLIQVAKFNDIDPQVWPAEDLARLPDHPPGPPTAILEMEGRPQAAIQPSVPHPGSHSVRGLHRICKTKLSGLALKSARGCPSNWEMLNTSLIDSRLMSWKARGFIRSTVMPSTAAALAMIQRG